ncbi:MAG: hypothetical protein KAH48_09650 [Chlorobi bacterium]|nr:hypothetical protein [Chlorobiota bacterium]
MKRFIILTVFCLTAILLPGKSLVASDDNFPATNLQVLDSLAASVGSSLISYLSHRGFDSLDISLGESPAKYYIKHRIIGAKHSQPLHLFEKVDNSKRMPMVITINKCAISFHNIPNQPDSLIRRGEINLSVFIRTRENELISLPVFVEKQEDRVARDNVDALQNNSFPFLNPNIPDPELSFFEEFIEPIILVSSAVLTVVLLFTVRSN